MFNVSLIWLIAVVVFLILEAVTYQLISIWFVFGASAGLISSFVTDNFYIEMGVFLAVSILMLAILRPLSIRLVKKQDFKSNVESLIGKTVLITQEVNNLHNSGQGKVNGMYWTVRSEDDKQIPAGELKRIVRIEGVKLIVSSSK
ncbi:MAG: NfeD family protein [bacterium]|nr:NfeD family protein [bacterium]